MTMVLLESFSDTSLVRVGTINLNNTGSCQFGAGILKQNQFALQTLDYGSHSAGVSFPPLQTRPPGAQVTTGISMPP